MNKKVMAIVSVSPGDIVQLGYYYFQVHDVREPTHPAAPGLVYEGSYWSWDNMQWKAPTVVHLHEGSAVTPYVLDKETRDKWGLGDL